MRTVHPSGMIAHLWAHRSQEHARNQQSNFYFDGDTIYSYGRHFPIARHVERKGKRAVLMTTLTYSNTTAGHIGDVRRSIPGDVPVFNVPNVNARTNEEHAENYRSYGERISEAAGLFSRARSNAARYKARILNLNGEANAYAAFFGLRVKPVTGDISQIVELSQVERERLEAAEKRRQAKADRERRKKLAADIEAWKAGEHVGIGYAPETYMRIKGDVLQTSLGAEIPLDHARRAFPAILRCRQNGSTWERNGHSIHVGHFTIDSIDATGGIKAGCHRIEWPEIERIARQLELI